jgi:hypothetical protein
MASSKDEISETLFDDDIWDRLDFHLGSYVKSPIQLRYLQSKTSVIGRALHHGVVDLLDNITSKQSEYIENETTVLGTEHRLCHSRNYTLKVHEHGSNTDDEDEIDFEISSLAPTIFSQLREDIGISNENFRQSFSQHHLKDFTNPGKSGSLMYKTFDDLFILKTLRDYEARLLLQILSGYHLQLIQRSTIFNRYIGLYSIRLQASISTIEIFIVVMANAFTPALQIDEIFDLKGSKIKRKSVGDLSREKLFKLKDVDFMELYPYGIRIPTNTYQKLKLVIANDVKVLKKLNITDFSLILGVRHLDMTEEEMLKRRPTTGIGVLCTISNRLGVMSMMRPESDKASPMLQQSVASFSVPYLKPLEMLDEQIDKNLYYDDDTIAHASLPIPGIINQTNQRVYLYLAFVDMLQTFDSFKLIDQTFRKLTRHDRHLEYSVIEPDGYEKRINQFLFERVFIDAKDDFPWAITAVSKSVAEINNEDFDNKNNIGQHHHTIEREQSDTVLQFRF